MRQLLACLIFATLMGCTPPVEPTDTSAVLTIYAGGAFHGFTQSELFPDDVLRVTSSGPFGKDEKVRTSQLAPGAFAKARDYLFAHPIKRSDLREEDICEDYGGDIVSYQGPDKNIKYLSTCPNEAVRRLMTGLEGVIFTDQE